MCPAPSSALTSESLSQLAVTLSETGTHINWVYPALVEVRTTVVVDEELIDKVKRLYGLPTTRAAIAFALRSLVGGAGTRDMLDLEGAGWDGNLNEMRSSARY